MGELAVASHSIPTLSLFCNPKIKTAIIENLRKTSAKLKENNRLSSKVTKVTAVSIMILSARAKRSALPCFNRIWACFG